MSGELTVDAPTKVFKHDLPVDFEAVCVSTRELQSEVVTTNVILKATLPGEAGNSIGAVQDAVAGDLAVEHRIFTMLSGVKNKVSL